MTTPHNHRLCRIVFLFFLFVFSSPGFCEGQEQAVPDKEKITSELFQAAEKGDFETVKNLLTKYPEMRNARRNGGWTLLHMAFNSRELVEYLIEIGADIEARSDGQWTPLHNQAYRGHKESVALLLEHGADIEARHFYGATPLLSSIRWDRVDATKFLVEKGANINAADVLGRTPLITSAIEGHLALAKILLEADADIHLKDNNYKRTALHFAALYGHLNIVSELLKKGADPNEKDGTGKTPLDYANRYGHEKVAEFLKSSGAGGEIDSRCFGYSPRLKESLKEGEAYAWHMGEIGYAVKTKNHFLLFSYSGKDGALPVEPRLSNGHIDLDEVAACDIMVFAGEPHWRQHNPERYNHWQKAHKSISFIYSFEDKLGRNPNYFKDVEGPKYIHMPDGAKKTIRGVNVETIPVTRGSGFLVEADGLVIFSGGHHLLGNESQKEAFTRTIDYLKGTGKSIDLLILPGYFLYGRIFPSNLEGVEYAVQTLKPRAYLASASGASTEFLLSEVAAALKKYENQTKGFYPENRGDLFILTTQAQQDDFPVLTGPYLGQKPPGMTPELFAPDIITRMHEVQNCLTISPDGNEIYWGLYDAEDQTNKILFSKHEMNKWTEPRVAFAFQEDGDKYDAPFFSPDGKKLYFISTRPVSRSDTSRHERVWFVEREKEGWSVPILLPETINALNIHMQFSIAENDNIYFKSRKDQSPGKSDIFCSECLKGEYQPPTKLGKSVNSEYNEMTPFISKDESYLIFARNRTPYGYGSADLYVSFRMSDGGWTEAVNLGETVNTSSGETCPIVSPDGRYLFFSSDRTGRNEIYWVDAKVIEELKPHETK